MIPKYNKYLGNWPIKHIFTVLPYICLIFSGDILLLSDDLSGITQDSGTANAISQWWQNLNIISNGWSMPPGMKDLVDVMGWAAAGETESQRQDVLRSVGRMHFKGGKYVASISTFDAFYETYLAHPELASTAVIDIYGKPLIVPWESTSQKPLWWGNTNHPLWQDFLIEQAKAVVDAGVDGIIIDEIEGTYDAIRHGGSFSEQDMSGFREYLAEIYTPKELLDQFGIENIETFNYMKYIQKLNLANTWMTEKWKVPLSQDFLRFQRLAIVKFMTKLVTETKTYALEKYNREVAFTANIYALSPNQLVFSELLDYYTAEYPYMDYGYPPESQASPDYKLARALGNKPAVILPHIETNADLAARKSTSTFMKICIAEAYANRGVMMVPYGFYAWSEKTGPGSYNGDLTVLSPFYRFIKDNPFLYEKLDSMAQTAILYSFPTDYYVSGKYRNSFRGLAYALLDGHVQYDILASGDNVFLPDTLSLESLKPYKVIFLTGTSNLSDSQVDILTSFVYDGGVVSAWGDIGTKNEKDQKVERPKIAQLENPGVYKYIRDGVPGKGRFIILTGDPGDNYRQTRDPNERQQLVSTVSSSAETVATTSVPRTLNIISYKSFSGSYLVTHLINYDYNINTDQITSTGPFTLTLDTPEGFLEKKDIQVYLLSPDGKNPSLINYTIGKDSLSINHQGVEIYDVLIAISKAEAMSIANKTLDVFAQRIINAIARGYDITALSDLQKQINDATASGNYMLARQLGMEALEKLKVFNRYRILFDEAHDEGNSLSLERAAKISPQNPQGIYFGLLRSTLEDEFIFEPNPDAILSPDLLKGYDILMLSAPRKKLNENEINAVKQFVTNGGGFIILGDSGLNDSANSIINSYGINFDSHTIFSPIPENKGDFIIRNFVPHKAIENVSHFMLSWAGTLTVKSPAEAFAHTDENVWQDNNWSGNYNTGDLIGPFIIAASCESGRGRVVAVSDNSFQDGAFDWRSNDMFMRGNLRWLVNNDIKCDCDLNVDEIIDLSDLLLAARNLGRKGAEAIGDVNKDGIINIFDLVLISIYFGESCFQ